MHGSQNAASVVAEPVMHLELRISLQIFEKFVTRLMKLSGALGKTNHEKASSKKSHDIVPLKRNKKTTCPIRLFQLSLLKTFRRLHLLA
jgi:hypothetical protein